MQTTNENLGVFEELQERLTAPRDSMGVCVVGGYVYLFGGRMEILEEKPGGK